MAIQADDRLIVALDFHTMEDVKSLVEKLGESVSYYKVGMELFYSVGGEVVRWLRGQGKHVFLDLKLHDIPNTVAGGLCSLMDLGADILNVHASGGYTMMKTAADRLHAAAEERGIPCPKLIAITVLTSINQEDWAGVGQTLPIKDAVVRLAKLAKSAGLDGVVASPQEATLIREACGEDFLIVTPGVRPAGSAINDQSRIATPAAALKSGASHLVIGRPIRAAEDPKAAAEAILDGTMKMTEEEVKDLLVKTNAIMNGHFLLTSGLHSPHYVEKFNVLQHPKYTQQLCEAMAEKFKDANIETVVGPMTGGILLAHETGKALGTRAIFTERVDGKMTFRRGFHLHPGERCLIVEDIVTTGGSIKEVIDVVKANGGIPVAVSMLVDRSGGKVNFGDVPCTALLHLNVETYKPEDCPLCKQGIPMTKRGRTGR